MLLIFGICWMYPHPRLTPIYPTPPRPRGGGGRKTSARASQAARRNQLFVCETIRNPTLSKEELAPRDIAIDQATICTCRFCTLWIVLWCVLASSVDGFDVKRSGTIRNVKQSIHTVLQDTLHSRVTKFSSDKLGKALKSTCKTSSSSYYRK